jgi:DNA-binding transcriptional MerR regulator
MDNPARWYRISQLEELSGVNRRTIHFYLKEGLLPPPRKTGQTMAYYDESHLRRLKMISQAKQQGAPLFAIKEQLGNMEDALPRSLGNKLQESKKALPKSAQGQKTREAVLEIGCRLFRKKGFANTKVADITQRLKVGKGTFYFYFSDKKELFLECAPRIFAELFSVGWEKIREEKNPLNRLKMRGDLVLPVLDEFCAILSLAKEAMAEKDEKLKKLGEQIFTSIRLPLERDIEKGVETGLLRPINPMVYASMMIGGMEGLNHLILTKKNLPKKSYENAVYELFTFGMAKPSPDDRAS